MILALSAALLMAVDGLSLVMSRVALLDIFLMFFILLTFYFLLKEYSRPHLHSRSLLNLHSSCSKQLPFLKW